MNQEYDVTTERLARGLGWTSLGLGLVQLAAPRTVSRICGVDDSTVARAVVPAAGARELVHAATLLAGSRPAPWTWARVAGDAMDLTALTAARRSRRGLRRIRATAATGAVVAISATDLYTAVRWALGRRRRPAREAAMAHVHAAITVNRPRSEVYRSWHDVEDLPRFMTHLQSVRPLGDGRSHWTARAPLGRTAEWDAVIAEDRPDEVIAWRSLRGSAVDNSGRVSFADASGGRGTEVRVDLEYSLPGGKVGAAVAKVLGEHPDQQVHEDLRRFKQYLEVGEVVRSEGSPEGPVAARRLRQRPAQPVR